MKHADRVLIIEFQDKYSDSGHNEISQGTNYLESKAKRMGKDVEKVFYLINGADFVGTSNYMRNLNPLSNSEAVLRPIREGLAKLTDKSELIIRGHGSIATRTVGKVNPAAMANFLCHMGLKVNCKINITSCKAGRDWTLDQNDVSALTADEVTTASWAREFQASLISQGLKINEIHARVQNVFVINDGSKTKRTLGSDTKGQHTAHQPKSKVILLGDGQGGSSYAYKEYDEV